MTENQISEIDIDLNYVHEKAQPFDDLFRDCPLTIVQAVSKKEREEKVDDDVSFELFGICLRKIQDKYSGLIREGGTFYDIWLWNW